MCAREVIVTISPMDAPTGIPELATGTLLQSGANYRFVNTMYRVLSGVSVLLLSLSSFFFVYPPPFHVLQDGVVPTGLVRVKKLDFFFNRSLRVIVCYQF